LLSHLLSLPDIVACLTLFLISLKSNFGYLEILQQFREVQDNEIQLYVKNRGCLGIRNKLDMELNGHVFVAVSKSNQQIVERRI
jgi:hypothetical protein